VLFDRDYDPLTKPGLEAELDPDFYSGQGMPALRPLFNEGGGNPRDARLGDVGITMTANVAWAAGVLKFDGFSAGSKGLKLSVSAGSVWSWWAFVSPNASQQSDYANLCAQSTSRGMWIRSGKLNLLQGGVDHLASTSVVAGAMQMLGVSYDSGNVKFYYQGQPDGVASVSSLSYTFDGIGADSGNSNPYSGLMDSMGIVPFILSPGQFALLAASPYADVLQPRAMRVFGAAASFQPAWASGANVLIGGGLAA
jgi:hypothetical protein